MQTSATACTAGGQTNAYQPSHIAIDKRPITPVYGINGLVLLRPAARLEPRCARVCLGVVAIEPAGRPPAGHVARPTYRPAGLRDRRVIYSASGRQQIARPMTELSAAARRHARPGY